MTPQIGFDENSIIDVSSCTSSDDESARPKLDDLTGKENIVATLQKFKIIGLGTYTVVPSVTGSQ